MLHDISSLNSIRSLEAKINAIFDGLGVEYKSTGVNTSLTWLPNPKDKVVLIDELKKICAMLSEEIQTIKDKSRLIELFGRCYEVLLEKLEPDDPFITSINENLSKNIDKEMLERTNLVNEAIGIIDSLFSIAGRLLAVFGIKGITYQKLERLKEIVYILKDV